MSGQSIETILANAGVNQDPTHHSLTQPVYTSTTNTFQAPDKAPPHQYARLTTPNASTLASVLSEINGGIGGLATNSGMAALNTLIWTLEPDDVVFAPYDMYGRAYYALKEANRKNHFTVKFVDPYNLDNLKASFNEIKPTMVMLETPSNTLLRIADIGEISKMSHKVGAKVCTDNTFLSPVRQKPFEHGADINWDSTTKMINGHDDALGGVLLVKDDDKLLTKFHDSLKTVGSIQGARDAAATLNGLKTLAMRMDVAERNAQTALEYLSDNPLVDKIYYPGLESHPNYEVGLKQQSGPGVIMSIELSERFNHDGGASLAHKFLDNLKLFPQAQSFGGPTNFSNIPSTMTHFIMTPEEQLEAGIKPGLIRLYFGTGNIDDTINDLDQASQAVTAHSPASFD